MQQIVLIYKVFQLMLNLLVHGHEYLEPFTMLSVSV